MLVISVQEERPVGNLHYPSARKAFIALLPRVSRLLVYQERMQTRFNQAIAPNVLLAAIVLTESIQSCAPLASTVPPALEPTKSLVRLEPTVPPVVLTMFLSALRALQESIVSRQEPQSPQTTAKPATIARLATRALTPRQHWSAL